MTARSQCPAVRAGFVLAWCIAPLLPATAAAQDTADEPMPVPTPAATSTSAPPVGSEPPPAQERRAGHVSQVYNVGLPLYTHNFTKGTDVSIADRLAIAEFVGAHYFVTDQIRIGMMVQVTEQFTGSVPAGGDRWTTFALLPQIGWHFYKRLFAAAIFTYAPRSGGKSELDLGMQALFGGSVPITDYASLGLALEIPVNLKVATTIGVTPLVGLSYRL